MKEKIIIELFKKKCIQFGTFTLKNGSQSNIYIDFKNIISYPFILNLILEELYLKLKLLEFDKLLGIPYSGIILTSSICSKYNLPMIMVRKEIKKYGFKKSIGGTYNKLDTCLIIEDTITKGSSVLHLINMIKAYKLIVKDIIVICDRRTNLHSNGSLGEVNIHSLFTIKDIIDILYKYDHISKKIYNSIDVDLSHISYNTYLLDYNNINLKKILDLITTKKNNYCFDIRFNCFNKLLSFIDFYRNDIVLIKIYSDLIQNLDYKQLIVLSQKYGFLIMEGKQFHFSESNFLNEYSHKKLYDWCHLIELSDLHSPNVFNVLEEFNINTKRPVSVIYNSYNTNSKLLYILNKNKNIIGLNSSYINCDILIFDTVESNNSKANIIVLEPKYYMDISNNFIPIHKIL